ncbi:MAG: hypothetical protein JWQ18_1935, partial [Conexibacter sp.]|nr:hypothetical protein [Conexibacter sp.]
MRRTGLKCEGAAPTMRATTPERPLRDAARRGAALALLASLLVLAVLAVAPAAQAWDVLTPTGTDPSAVTDRDGTTHVVWDVTHANSYDTVDYCQIPRGATTCATTVDLTPECTTDPGGTTQPIAWKQDQSDSRWHGDKPRVMVTRFGDVYITTHGVCPLDWQAYGTSNPPWSNFQGVDREITMHSADGGATFDSSSGQARANGPKYTADQGAVFSDDRSDTVYDEADNRFVTVQDAYGGDIHGNSGNDGLFVLGNQPPPPMSDGQITAGRLVPFPDGGNPVLVQRGRGSFATAYLRQQAGGIGIRTYDCAGCPLADLAAAADWSSEILLPDEDHQPFAPKIVSGPAGTFVFYHTSPPDPNFWVRKLTGTTLGPRSKIMPAQDVDVETGDIAEDPANGRLIAAFQVATNASEIPWETDYVVSDDGGMTWTPAAKAADAPPGHSNDAMNTSITESTGDNGFTGLMFQYRDLDSGPIYVTALPGSGLPP